jgi:tagatose 1,6-diphosphate aldolase
MCRALTVASWSSKYEGSTVFSGEAAYTMADALGFYREADRIAHRPYVYLSAGVSGAQFLESLRMAGEAGSQFSGVLCGRATWSEGISEYALNGSEGLKRWLATSGGEYVRQIRECLNAAVPWDSRTRISVG